MSYIYTDFEGIKYWVEIDDEGYALRQVIEEDGEISVSCREDCLAEGVVEIEYFENIKSEEFEKVWEKNTQDILKVWNREKCKS